MTLLGTSNRSKGSLGFLPQIPPLPRLGIRGLPAQSFRNGSWEPIFLEARGVRRWRAYVVWCGEVVVGLRGVSPFLEGEFDRVVAAFQDALNMAAIISPSSIGGATAPRRSSLRYGGPGCRALLGRGGQTGTAPWAVRCRLLPQKQVYCCSAVSEAMGQNRP